MEKIYELSPQQRINIMQNNLYKSQLKLDLGEITPSQYNSLKLDVEKRIKEIKFRCREENKRNQIIGF